VLPRYFLTTPLLLLTLAVAAAAQSNGVARASGLWPRPGDGDASRRLAPQKITREGLTLEVSVEPLKTGEPQGRELREGEEAAVTIKITDAATGTPLSGIRPSAWLDLRRQGEARTCQQKVQSFIQGSLGARPEVDLNAYFLLALNDEPNISVIDPLFGYGTSKLYTLVPLKSRGEDWAMTRDGRRLYVSLPLVNEVAVVDTATWKVVTNVDAGYRPTRLALQADGRYLWVGNDADDAAQGGVTVIDTHRLTVAAKLQTGAGRHEIALGGDDRFAFVTNQDDGTLSVIDTQRLQKVKDIPAGKSPVALAVSPLSQAVYVVSEADGLITIIDGGRHEVLKRLEADAGLRAVGFAPGGRWGFAVNRRAGVVNVFDASDNRLLETVPTGKAPDQIAFTKTFAYVRAAGSDEVTLIELAGVGRPGGANVTRIPAGRAAEQSPHQASAAVLAPGPEGNTMLIANPADQLIYYYSEGMAAPMGSFQNYRRVPRAVAVVDRSLRQSAPGVYAANVRLPRGGEYDFALLTDSPRVVHCFDLAIQPNPELRDRRAPLALKLEPLVKEHEVRAGESARLQFRLTDPATGQPKEGLKDVRVLALLAPGTRQQRHVAEPRGDGVYEVSITAPEAGVYYVFVECPSLKVKFNQLPYIILHATDTENAAPAARRADEGDK
jgi:YVTN family beta-propeller protein